MLSLLFRALLLAAVAAHSAAKCPKMCSCALKSGRKTVVCDRGGLTKIPTPDMDLNTHVLVISPPSNNPNNLTIGRIFLKFHQLEEVRVTDSNVPAIGDSSFWPGRRLRLLDLSHNGLRFLQESDFNGLKNLKVLDLSDNQIAATPSAPFRYLTSLTWLSLARNRLDTLVPRFFYLLPQLEHLDLSGNPLRQLDPENLQDVGHLRSLRLADCRLSRLHSTLYQQLPELEELDLRHNHLTTLAPEEFRHLRALRVLQLDGNLLTAIEESTFDGHSLDVLGLSANQLTTMSSCSFCNTSVAWLDLSFNQLTSLHGDVLGPLAPSLHTLNLTGNKLTGDTVAAVFRPLQRLRTLVAVDLQLSVLPEDTFAKNSELRALNLSGNALAEVADNLLGPLKELQQLDLSGNQLPGLNATVLGHLANMSSLSSLRLQDNLWSCTQCDILPLLLWMNASAIYNGSCEGDACLRCAQPDKLAGTPLANVREEQLDTCFVPVEKPRTLVHTSQLGLLVAIAIIVALVIIIVIIVVMYRRQRADYYTHEEERPTGSVYENPTLSGTNGGFSDEKPTFVAAGERVDDIGDIGRPRNSFS